MPVPTPPHGSLTSLACAQTCRDTGPSVYSRQDFYIGFLFNKMLNVARKCSFPFLVLGAKIEAWLFLLYLWLLTFPPVKCHWNSKSVPCDISMAQNRTQIQHQANKLQPEALNTPRMLEYKHTCFREEFFKFIKWPLNHSPFSLRKVGAHQTPEEPI